MSGVSGLGARAISSSIMVAERRLPGRKCIDRFGRNADIDAATIPEDIWEAGGMYTGFPTGAAETLSIASDDVTDANGNTGAWTLYIEGLDQNWNYAFEIVTLTGTTPVVTTSLWQRVNKAYVVTAGSGLTNAGIITVRHSSTTANIFATIAAGVAEAHMAVYTIPGDSEGSMLSFTATLLGSANNNAEGDILVREPGSVFRHRQTFGLTGGQEATGIFNGGFYLPPKTDIKIHIDVVSTSNLSFIGRFHIHEWKTSAPSLT